MPRKVPVPGQLHADVPIVMTVLRETRPGEVCPYETIEKALGITRAQRAFWSRCETARRHLAQEIQFKAVPGEGFRRLTSHGIKEEQEGPQKRKRVRANERNRVALDAIDLAELSREEQMQVITEKVRLSVHHELDSKSASKKLLNAVQATGEVPAIANALRALTNGKSSEET